MVSVMLLFHVTDRQGVESYPRSQAESSYLQPFIYRRCNLIHGIMRITLRQPLQLSRQPQLFILSRRHRPEGDHHDERR